MFVFSSIAASRTPRQQEQTLIGKISKKYAKTPFLFRTDRFRFRKIIVEPEPEPNHCRPDILIGSGK